MKYKLLFFDFLGVFVQPRSAAVIFRGALSDGFIQDMKNVVATLAEDHVLVLISASSRKEIEGIFENYDVSKYFSDIISSYDKASDMKRILEEYDLDPEHAVLITDTCSDVRAGKLVPLESIGVSWGLGRIRKLKECGAINVAETPKELLGLLKL